MEYEIFFVHGVDVRNFDHTSSIYENYFPRQDISGMMKRYYILLCMENGYNVCQYSMNNKLCILYLHLNEHSSHTHEMCMRIIANGWAELFFMGNHVLHWCDDKKIVRMLVTLCPHLFRKEGIMNLIARKIKMDEFYVILNKVEYSFSYT